MAVSGEIGCGSASRSATRAALALENPPPPRLIVAVPGDRARETLLERGARPPPGQPFHLLGGADVTIDLARPLGDERLQGRRLPELLEDGLCDFRDRDVDP